MKLELVKITNNRGNNVYYVTKNGEMDKEHIYNHLDEAMKAFSQIQDEWQTGKREVLMAADL